MVLSTEFHFHVHFKFDFYKVYTKAVHYINNKLIKLYHPHYGAYIQIYIPWKLYY
jgi:hypothetical protein